MVAVGMFGPPADPLTLALAVTVTWMLAVALTEALAAAVAQASALPPMLPTSDTTALPLEPRVLMAARASGPCVCTAAMIAGKLFCTVVTTACAPELAEASHSSVTVGLVHEAWMSAWL